MKLQGIMARNFTSLGVCAALIVVILTGCGGGGGGSGGGAGSSDSVAPAVLSSAPADGAIEVAVDAILKITFTEPVDPATVNGTTVKIRSGDTEMAGTVRCAHDTITLTPATNWGFATTYTATISGGPSGVKDLAGNSLAADHTWTFSTGQGPDIIPPVVTATSPISGTTGVSVNTTVTAIFSEAVMNVTSTTFRLAADGVAVPGAVTTSGAAAIFTPSVPLAYNTAYVATVTAGVTDLAGNSLSAEAGWTFTTSGMSGSATVISNGTDSVSGVQLAMDTTGTAVAVWAQGNGIWSNRYASGTGWGVATTISSGGGAEAPQVAMGGSGSATAVWRQLDGAQYSIYANRYLPGTGWGTATIIDTGAGQAGGVTGASIALGGPQVGMDTNGNAIAVWPQWDGGGWSIYANRYVPGTGWGTDALIENSLDNTYDPKMAMNRTGTAIVVWHDLKDSSSGSGGSVYANRYEPGTGWGNTTSLDNASGYSLNPDVAVDDSGNAIALWTQVNPHQAWQGICVRRYEPGTGWGTETVLIETRGPGFGLLSSEVAMGGTGNSVVVGSIGTMCWECVHQSYIFATNYLPGAGWTPPTYINTGINYFWAEGPRVSLGHSGNAVAVWNQGEYSGRPPYDIYANRYVAETGWGTANVVETSAENASSPRVTTDGNGNFIIVWQQSNGARSNVSAVRYRVP